MYEYECQDCHRRLEKIQTFSAAPITVCPTCGGRLERTLTAPAIQFKGAGWYVNDYSKSGSEKKSRDSADISSAKTATTDSSSDSASPAKPADSGSSKEASSSKDSSSSKSDSSAATASTTTSVAASPASSNTAKSG